MPSANATIALLLSPEFRAQMLTAEAEKRLASFGRVVAPADGEMKPETLSRLVGDASVALTGWGTPPITTELLAERPALKLVAHSAGSVRRLVPADAIGSGRLAVSHVAIHIAEAVAEFVLAQTLSILREPHLHDAGMKAGTAWFELRERHLGRMLGGQTVGLVGAGYVGRLVIRLFKAFDARVIVFDPFLTPERAAELGVESVSLDTLLTTSDIVSLHAPVLPETRHMIGKAEFAKLRDGTIFINSARSALVDEAALIEALGENRFIAALDVYDIEPLPADSPFRRFPNAVLAPHAAGHTADTHKRQGATAVEEIGRFLRGEPLRHPVTPAMLATMA
jgi:phosphoglycerate dehydrogenase-like enzyme